MISIVNYGLGNLGSIVNMLQYLGIPSQIINYPDDLTDVAKIILPGIGAFDAGMEGLKTSSWIEILRKKVVENKVPVLGICLGMQLMTQSSNEGDQPGLGWIEGTTGGG